MPKKKSYTEKDITVLSDRDHVRLRLPVYAGSTKPTRYSVPVFTNDDFEIKRVTFIPAVYKCIGEIIDNCVDEFAQTDIKNPILTIEANELLGTYLIGDNGRGVPIGKMPDGQHTPQVVFGSLRSGRNFGDNKEAGVIGMNGMGSCITNFCSTEFDIKIHRDGKVYKQRFSNGGDKVSKPSIRSVTNDKTGTEISFTLDPEVFDNITLPDNLMNNRAMELAFTNPGLTVKYNKKKYKFKKGLETIVKQIVEKNGGDYFKFEVNNDGMVLEFFVVFGVHKNVDEAMFSWVNSSLLFDGGLCNTQFLNAFYDKTINHLKSQAKKQKCDVTKNDIRQNLLVFGNLKLSDPQYDAQSKTRLTGPNLRKEMSDLLSDQWKVFSRKNKDWLADVLERAADRHHTSANKKAMKSMSKGLRRKVPGLVDANSKMRHECQILITEGLSAASMITDVRNPKTMGSFPLTGKMNNVYGSTVAQVIGMGKLTNLLSAIGLVPGKKAARLDMRFGKIVIATDADQDGADIFTLLINLFFQFWPELFDENYEPIVFRLIAPNVCVVKGDKRIHFTNRNDYEKVKAKYRGWTVNYLKGLGSMERKDWEMILSGDDCLTPIINDGDMEPVLELLFGPDADARKDWLQN